MSFRNIISIILAVIAAGCIGYFAFYYYMAGSSTEEFDDLSKLKDKKTVMNYAYEIEPGTIAEETEPVILPKYEILYNKNKNLIGWLKIDDTNIDYPVMKSVNGDGSYYLEHNFDQKEDKNGTLFMDDACDVIDFSDNLIIYGHNMKSGQMFGTLDYYADESYYKKHPAIKFDTIYEEGVYDVMFAFRSQVYSEAEIVFKYYQFIDAVSEKEFDSSIEEMRKMSLYDTGVDAEYGDRLLTLSTCDYQEEDGRFVVVCKKRD